MCVNCWVSEGSHSIVNDKTKEAAALIDDIYDSEDGGAGGYAHIVVDDWNLEDSDIQYCITYANTDRSGLSEECREASLKCLLRLKELSIEERYSAMAIHSNLIQSNQ